MPIINITVKGKVASSDTKVIVNGNSDYAVNWVLDGEWADYDTKTMRVRFFDGSVINSIFSGTSCSLPVITETCMIEIGLFAGDLITSTPAVINCIRCIRDDEGPVQDPTPSIYDQLLAKLNELGSGSAMRVDGGYVQYSTDNGKTWVNLIAEADLKGGPGAPGTPGTPGKDGVDGHTPVKGTDYWTASDKAEVVAEAAAAIDLTSYAKKNEVPTKTSQLTNDSGFLTSHQDISGKQDKATLEADVAAKGFTKNTGTYSKPTGGIPKADLAEAVQTSLGKADTALQEHQSLAAYRTAAAQDVIDSGKVDKVTGKGLSTNDYTAAAKAKVDAIPANPKYTDTVYDDTALKERVATIEGKESAWDAKSDFSGSYNDLTDKPTIPTEVTPLIGTTNELTPTQVYDAVSAGIPVKVQYTDSTYGLLSFTAFNIAESFTIIVSQTIVYANGGYILAELIGGKYNNTWGFDIITLAQKTDIPSALPNPNAITFTGAVTGSYDGSAPVTVNIPGGGSIVPAPSSADDGKILRVVDGSPAWVSIASATGVRF